MSTKPEFHCSIKSNHTQSQCQLKELDTITLMLFAYGTRRTGVDGFFFTHQFHLFFVERENQTQSENREKLEFNKSDDLFVVVTRTFIFLVLFHCIE